MLWELHIRDLGVIYEARLEVSPGLNVLTGETGAGKTMVVGALGLLLGARADPGAVRVGSSEAAVEGRLALDAEGRAAAALAAAGMADEDGEVIAARQVQGTGRSRAQLQGRMTTVAALGDVVGAMVEVHGQHDFQRLLQPGVLRELLDRFAGTAALELRDRFAAAWRRLREVTRELDELVERSRERAREADVLRYQLDEIAAAEVRPGESVALAEESERLANAETLRQVALAAWQALEGDEEGAAATALGGAARLLAGQRGHDPAVAELAGRTEALAVEAADLASALRAYAEGVVADPERLEAVGARLALLRDLERKYGPDRPGEQDPEAAVLEFAERAAARLAELEGGEARTEALDAEVASLRAALAEVGARLSEERRGAAGRLAKALQAELVDLAMPHAVVDVAVEQDPQEGGLVVGGSSLAAGEHGLDRVDVRLSANPGMAARPLAKAASGGELSRVMLALRVVLAGIDRPATLVFDEVDSGIGGRTAAAVGHRLAQLAAHHQVLVVTHLPQIAAYADRHFTVDKRAESGEATTTAVRALDGAGRVTELSRMLAGMEGSDLAQAHAEELLAAAARAKAPPPPGERR